MPTLRQELPENNHTPAHRVKRQQRFEPEFAGCPEMFNQPVRIDGTLRHGEIHAGMQHEISDAGNWIVPAEIFEIHES